MAVYTLAVWTVKPGREDEFVRGWRALAAGTKADFPAARGTLLRDRDRPNVFISFGPWDSLDQVERWRTSDTFTARVGALRALLEDFAPHTMDLAVAID